MARTTRLKPLRDIVFVEPILRADEYTTKTGITVLKPKYQGVPNRGKVFACADNVHGIKKGNIVIFKDEHPTGLKHNGIKLLAINIKNIEAICE